MTVVNHKMELMLLKILLCFLVLCSNGHSEENEEYSFYKVRKAISSNFETFTQATKRAGISIILDFPTIWRQTTEDSYGKIVTRLTSGKTPFLEILAVHSVETFLRSQVIYSLYGLIAQQTREIAPELSKTHPIFPQIATIPFIAASDVIFMNPFERVKVCLLSKRHIPFYQQHQIDWSVILKSREWLFTGGALTFQTSFAHVSTFLVLKHFLAPLIVKSDKPSFYESLKMGTIIATAQTAITFPLLTFRAKLHDQQAELFCMGKARISTPQFFCKLARENRLLTLYYGWWPRMVRGIAIATQDASALHNK